MTNSICGNSRPRRGDDAKQPSKYPSPDPPRIPRRFGPAAPNSWTYSLDTGGVPGCGGRRDGDRARLQGGPGGPHVRVTGDRRWTASATITVRRRAGRARRPRGRGAERRRRRGRGDSGTSPHGAAPGTEAAAGRGAAGSCCPRRSVAAHQPPTAGPAPAVALGRAPSSPKEHPPRRRPRRPLWARLIESQVSAATRARSSPNSRSQD